MFAYPLSVIIRFVNVVRHTVSAGLHGSLNIANTLNRETVLVVSVDVLVLELADLVQEYAKLVGHIGHVLVAGLAPNGELLL